VKLSVKPIFFVDRSRINISGARPIAPIIDSGWRLFRRYFDGNRSAPKRSVSSKINNFVDRVADVGLFS